MTVGRGPGGGGGGVWTVGRSLGFAARRETYALSARALYPRCGGVCVCVCARMRAPCAYMCMHACVCVRAHGWVCVCGRMPTLPHARLSYLPFISVICVFAGGVCLRVGEGRRSGSGCSLL